jgi:two-component system, OmpR family, response regulator QseB
MRALLVEDDQLLGDGLRAGLDNKGYTVDWLKDGEDAENALLKESFDAVILDLGLPRRTGLDIIKAIRGKGVNTPILVLTARDEIEQRISALDSGADDYLTKPFDLNELAARLRALVRRTSGRAEPTINYGQLSLDPASHMVYRRGRQINVSPKEFALLHKLLENMGRVLSREQLAQTLYGWDNEIDSNAVEVHIHNLRKKLGIKIIRTIRGVGYMIDRNNKQL